MTLALVKNDEFVRLIPDDGWVEVEPGLNVSPPQAGWKHEDWTMLDYEPFVVPDGKIIDGEVTYQVDGSIVREIYAVVNRPAPAQETLADWRVGLILMGRFADVKASVEAARDTGEPSGLIAWERFEYANHTYRQELLALMPAFGFTAEEVDESMWKARNVSQGILQPGPAVRT